MGVGASPTHCRGRHSKPQADKEGPSRKLVINLAEGKGMHALSDSIYQASNEMASNIPILQMRKQV